MRLLRAVLMILGAALLAGCDESPDIPDDVSYSIVNEGAKRSGAKRSLDIRLNKKVTEGTLRAIALELKSRESRSYDRTLMNYYLPEMTPGGPFWATTNFNPDLEVKILEFTIEEEDKIKNKKSPSNHEVIGRWMNDGSVFGSYIEI